MAAFLPALIGAAGSIGGGLLGGLGSSNKETKMQKTQRKLVDQLLKSLSGEGPYSGLFDFDEESFQKSFVEPAQARFRNQIAPQIQQQSIAYGQQRGTGLDDTLTRAGVDLDSLLNAHMMQYQESAKNRQQGVIGSILGMGGGAPSQPSFGQDIMSALGGYLSGTGFSENVPQLFQPQSSTTAPPTAPNYYRQRRGYDAALPNFLDDPRYGGMR